MDLAEKIEHAFAARSKPAEVLPAGMTQLDSDTDEALWFSGRDWRTLIWNDWQKHSCAIYFFAADAFAYYLPSILILSAQNQNDELSAADSLISQLDRSPNVEAWSEDFAGRFLKLHPEELVVLKEWLLQVCEYVPYKGVGLAASGPGDKFGRAYDTVDLLQKEIQRMCSANSSSTRDFN